VARLFDAYIIVDWSAAAKPVTGANSIWIGARVRDAGLNFQFISANPRTRLDARKYIGELAEKLIECGDKILIGFDFALGYPSGTAAAIGLDTHNSLPWRAMYDCLASKVSEPDDNSNTRFALAAELNHAISKSSHPFWGAPRSKVVPTLSMKKGDFAAEGSLLEHRICERWIKANFKAHPKSVWQLLGAGSVGSQAMLGIPTVAYLRDRLANSKVWPFETGLLPLTPEMLENTNCVFAEVYPSTVSVAAFEDETLDEAQVRTLSKHLESLDSTGELASAFGPPDTLSDPEIREITCEEGWILAK